MRPVCVRAAHVSRLADCNESLILMRFSVIISVNFPPFRRSPARATPAARNSAGPGWFACSRREGRRDEKEGRCSFAVLRCQELVP